MEEKRKLITGAIVACVVITISALIIHHYKKDHSSAGAMLPVNVQVAHPIVQTVSTTVSALGYLVAKESTSITPRASGYVTGIDFHEGQVVPVGTVLFQLDKQTQQEALTAAKASADLSKMQYERDKSFLKKGFITQDMFYSAESTYKQNKAALETAHINLSDRSIVAPFGGTVGAMGVSVGDYVNPGKALTTLVDNAHLRAEYTLPVKVLNQLRANQSVIIADSANKTRTTATVSYIAPVVDQNTQTIAVHAEVNNTNNLFKPGEYVTITQTLGSHNNVFLLPEKALQGGVTGYAVFIVKNKKAARTSVEIGKRINGQVIITSGLTATDEVIVAGENEVKNAQPVNIITTQHNTATEAARAREYPSK